MRPRPSAVFLFCFVLCFLLTGCKPERHPRRDRKARGLALQNASRTQALADDQAALRDDLCAKVDDRVANLQAQIDALRHALDKLAEENEESDERCKKLVVLLAGLSRNGNTLILSGANLRIQDADGGPPAPGLGNLLIGRDDAKRFRDFYGRNPRRDGSNNLIIGGANEYYGSGGLCAGVLNLLNSDASVVFSCENETKGEFAVVLGGTGNLSQGRFATVCGGLNRVASGRFDFRAGHLFSDQ